MNSKSGLQALEQQQKQTSCVLSKINEIRGCSELPTIRYYPLNLLKWNLNRRNFEKLQFVSKLMDLLGFEKQK